MQETKNKIRGNKHLNCLIVNAPNKRRINEKKCGVFSRAAFINIFACPCGGVYSREAFIRVITVCIISVYYTQISKPDYNLSLQKLLPKVSKPILLSFTFVIGLNSEIYFVLAGSLNFT